MKFSLELSNEVGTITVSLNKEFAEQEIQNITSILINLLKENNKSKRYFR